MSIFSFCLRYLTFSTPTPFLFLDRSPSFGPFWLQNTVKPPLMATSLQWQWRPKRVPNCRNNLSTTAGFFSDWRKWQEWSQNLIHMASQRVIGASLSIQLKGKYITFLVRPFLEHVPQAETQCHITPLPPYNGHHSTTATFFCPQGSHCGEVRLYQELTAPIPILLYFQTMSFFKCYSEMLVKCWRNVS